MKVVIAHRSGHPRVVQLPEPAGAKKFVTVRVSHSAMRLPWELEVLETISRRLPAGQDGLPLGGAASGTIVHCGEEVRTLKEGIRVAVTGAPYVYHGEQLVVPESLAVELPKKVNHEEGSFTGQGADAMNLLRVAGLQLGDTAVVMGADMLGFLTAQVIRASGATALLVDESEFRLKKANATGIPETFTPESEKLVRAVAQHTDGQGAKAVFLTRAHDRDAFLRAVELARYGGVIVMGAPSATQVPLTVFLEKSLQLRSALGGSLESIENGWTVKDNMACFAQLLAERKVQISPLISDRIPLERAVTAYEKSLRGRDAVLGVVLTL